MDLCYEERLKELVGFFCPWGGESLVGTHPPSEFSST